MFLFNLFLFILIGISVNGETNNINRSPIDKSQQGALFGQFHQLIENQNKDFSFTHDSSFTSVQSDQTTSVILSCYRIRPNIKNAHPIDNRKYYICRNENHYEVFTCPNGGIFDDRQKACIDLCEQKNPCLNQGQCIILPDLTLQCVCRQDWTGQHCEVPVSSCVNNPCGPNNECRMLKATDYPQDYVCLCNNHKTYGRTCQQTVPNPCLDSIQQFHPFAFSRRAYINCDGDLIFFQPCHSFLYWNQEDKRCDRDFPELLKAPFLHIRIQKSETTQTQFNVPQSQNFTTISQSFFSQNVGSTVPQSINNPQQMRSQNQQFMTAPPQKLFHLQGFSNGESNRQVSLNTPNERSNSETIQTFSQTLPSQSNKMTSTVNNQNFQSTSGGSLRAWMKK